MPIPDNPSLATSRSSFSQVLLVFFFALAVSTSVADAQVGAVFADVPVDSDDIGLSCAPLFERSSMAEEKVERLIHTGARHGAFYLLRDAWVEPMFAWIESRTPTGVQRR